jgi:predicted O-linked N-acetylglucosamine transferase (SPINDLY family)
MDELVAHSLTEYEMWALELARDPVRLADLRQKLARNRVTYPLFDTDRGRRAIESAYVEMHARHQRGEPPASFAVAPAS